MNDFLVLAAHNTLYALILAILVYAVTRVWRHPPAAHVLWLLVLLKLIAPPVMYFDWPARLLARSTEADVTIVSDLRQNERPSGTGDSLPGWAESDSDAWHESECRIFDQTSILDSVGNATAKSFTGSLTGRLAGAWQVARPILFWLWLSGAAACALISLTRILRFEQLLRDTLPAPERLQRLTQEAAAKIGIRHLPRICYAASVEVPLLWCAGCHPTIVMPMRLFQQIDDRTAAMILAHELAHLRRRDHWGRAIELVVAILHWWNPVAWWIRRQLHEVEDQCCDAWVRWVYPDSEQSYAEVVLKTAELLNVPRGIAALPAASPFFHPSSLKARIEMILNGRFVPRVSLMSMLVVALFGLLIVPSFAPMHKTAAQAGSDAIQPEVTKSASSKPEAEVETKTPISPRTDMQQPRERSSVARIGAQQISYEELAAECIARSGEEVLENLINRKVIQQACDERGINVSDAEVDAEIDRVAQRFQLDRNSWLKMLKSERKLASTQYRRDVIWPMLALRKLAGVEIAVKPEEIRRAFLRRYGARVKVKAIYLDNEEQATEIHARVIARPEEFEQLAREHSIDEDSRSQDGTIPPIQRYGRDDVTERTAFILQEGEVSDVTRIGPAKFIILKCEGRTVPSVTDIKEVEESLRQELEAQQSEQAVKMLEKLKREADIDKRLTDWPASIERMSDAARDVTSTRIDFAGKQNVEHRSPNEENRRPAPAQQATSEARLPILDADPDDRPEAPTTDEILRALPNQPSQPAPFVGKMDRKNVRIAIEKIGDKIGESRFYPMVGPARMHSCHYKCTVHYDKVIRSEWPVPYSHVEPNIRDVVHIDHNHLVRVNGPK